MYDAATEGDSYKVNALQRLIQDWLDAEPGRSIRGLASLSGISSPSTLHALMNRTEPASLPRKTTLRKLARGLGLPLHAVDAAAAAAAGFHVEPVDADSAEMQGWVALLDGLSEQDRRELWEIGRLKLRRMKEQP